MKLRARLVAGVIGTAVPLSLLLVSVQLRAEREQREARALELARARMTDVGRAECEADPAAFPWSSHAVAPEPLELFFDEPAPPRRREGAARMFAFGADLRSENPDAPALDPRLARAMRRGDEVAQRIVRGRPPLERTMVRMPWSGGPCAFVLVERPAPGRRFGLARLWPSLVITVAVALAMLGVAAPLVRRIRNLTHAVRRGEASRVADEGHDEITELAAALREREARIAAQIEELGAREEALRDYVANTTHDVLVPLTVLTGALVEVDASASLGRAPSTASVRTALEESHYLAGLLHNLNAQARLEARLPASDEPVELRALVERVVARHAPIARRAGISLEHAVPEERVLVRGDVTLLEQAVSNLVHNAVRHGREGGHVAVVLETRRGRFRLTVLDDGPGVCDDELARLGERGFRATGARTRRPDGMGLGLHIVREVSARHGLALAFAREEPSGLRVTLEGATMSTS